MKPFHPNNRTSIAGLMLLLIVSLLGGILVGGLAFLVSNVIYLILLFPIGMGFAAGALLMFGVQLGQVRFPLLAALFGLLIAAATYSTMHVGDYLQFRQRANDSIAQKYSLAPEEASELVDLGLELETGASGFWGFVLLRAEQGISITSIVRGSKSYLSGVMAWLYWLVEFAIIAGIAIFFAYSSAREPFCEGCQQWYTSAQAFACVDANAQESFLDLLRSGRFLQAGEMLSLQNQLPCGLVYLQRCPSCSTADSVLRVKQTWVNNKGKTEDKQLAQGMLTPHQLNDLLRALNRQQAEGAPLESA